MAMFVSNEMDQITALRCCFIAEERWRRFIDGNIAFKREYNEYFAFKKVFIFCCLFYF